MGEVPLTLTVEERHVIHYRNCNCLADSAECCDPTCPCDAWLTGRGEEPLTLTRPKWAEAIRLFVTDTVIDEKYGYPMDGSDDMKHGLIERAVLNAMCNIYGHDIVDDQCMIPEHRFCVYCNRREGAITE